MSVSTMAKIDVDDFMFECPICIEQFDDTCKMLPCQHTFCLSCLQKLYDVDQNPHCPTCRATVTKPIVELARPILLLSLLEKFKNRIEEVETAADDEFSVALELSVETFNKKQELDTTVDEQEDLQLQIALSKSEEDVLLEHEKQTLLEEKEKLEYEMALMKSSKLSDSEYQTASCSSSSTDSVQQIADVTDAGQENSAPTLRPRRRSVPMGRNTRIIRKRLSAGPSETSSPDSEHESSSSSSICGSLATLNIKSDESQSSAGAPPINALVEDEETEGEGACSVVDLSTACCSATNHSEPDDEEEGACGPVVKSPVADKFKSSAMIDTVNLPFHIFDLRAYGRNGNEQLLIVILNITSDERKLNELNVTELSTYINEVNEYSQALSLYRCDIMKGILKECSNDASNDKQQEWQCVMDMYNDITPHEIDNAEDREMAHALQLSREAFLESHEDKAFEVTLKKSEKIDPIDQLCAQLNEVREILEVMMVVLLSEAEV